MTNTVAIVLKGYPRLSESFIAQEIRELELRGLDIRLISLRHPTDTRRHPIHDEIQAPVRYLPEYLKDEPARVLRAWRAVRNLPGYRRARACWLRDLRRDPTPNRVRRFGQALVMAHELEDDVSWIYAHFLHTPASVARYAAMIRDLPWSCSAHAKDIWTSPEWEKREKLADCAWLATCTRANAEHLSALAPVPDRVNLVYHGLDFRRFPPPTTDHATRDGGDPGDPVILLSVGRAVEKKGYDILLEALARLPDDLNWRFVHIGGGEKLASLQTQAAGLKLDGRISWLGAQAQEEVIARYRKADLFVLPCRVTANGDRDGLPNVLMEAQSQGLPCISTTVSAIPELIIDGETGTLVESENPEALAAALRQMMAAPDRRRALGEAAQRRVTAEFGMANGIDILAAKFGLPQN